MLMLSLKVEMNIEEDEEGREEDNEWWTQLGIGGDSQLLSISIVYIKLSGLYKNMIIKRSKLTN